MKGPPSRGRAALVEAPPPVGQTSARRVKPRGARRTGPPAVPRRAGVHEQAAGERRVMVTRARKRATGRRSHPCAGASPTPLTTPSWRAAPAASRPTREADLLHQLPVAPASSRHALLIRASPRACRWPSRARIHRASCAPTRRPVSRMTTNPPRSGGDPPPANDYANSPNLLGPNNLLHDVVRPTRPRTGKTTPTANPPISSRRTSATPLAITVAATPGPRPYSSLS